MKGKFWILWGPLLILFLQSLIGLLPKTYDGIKKINDYVGTTFFLLYCFSTLIVMIFFSINQYYSIRKPFKKLYKVEKTKIDILDQNCSSIIDEYRSIGIELRINVMLVKRKILCLKKIKHFSINSFFKLISIYDFIEKLQKNHIFGELKLPLIFARKLFIVYYYNMDYDMDKKLSFFINQGVCGQAFREGLTFVDLKSVEPSEFNMDVSQLELTEHISYIISIPVWDLDLDTRRLTNKIVGVANFDTSNDMGLLIQNDSSIDQIYYDLLNTAVEKIKGVTKLVSLLY